jgi:hypothetical protein|tara:strand:- start:6053 stop:6805 length:753 start_codon:yes stop_codon:yes gene_type:complete
MRRVAALGAGILLASIFLDDRPEMAANPPKTWRQLCDNLADTSLCEAGSSLAALAKEENPFSSSPFDGALPAIPGAIDPAITQANLDSTICDPAFLTRAATSPSWKAEMRRRMVDQTYRGQDPTLFELDQLVPVKLGGARMNVQNLWLQPWSGPTGAWNKNRIEDELHQQVCARQIPLKIAQQLIARDWKQVFDPSTLPVAQAQPDSVPDVPMIRPEAEPVTLSAERIEPPSDDLSGTNVFVPAIGPGNF